MAKAKSPIPEGFHTVTPQELEQRQKEFMKQFAAQTHS